MSDSIIVNCIWAFVSLCLLGLCWAYIRGWYRMEVFQELRRATIDLRRELLDLDFEVRGIRGGLEKLKAIPPKQPRV